jgi:hypothetical protein
MNMFINERIVATNADDSTGLFADIVSNLLGVLVVVLLLISLLSASSGYNWPESSKESLVSVPYKRTKTTPFPPWEDIFIVAENVMAQWRPQKVVDLFINTSFSGEIRLPEGKVRLVDRPEPRDLDVFLMLFEIDWGKFHAAHHWLDYSPAVNFIKFGLPKAEASNRMLSFFVFPSGVDLFSRIYPDLLKHDIRFRVIRSYPDKPSDFCRWPVGRSQPARGSNSDRAHDSSLQPIDDPAWDFIRALQCRAWERNDQCCAQF